MIILSVQAPDNVRVGVPERVFVPHRDHGDRGRNGVQKRLRGGRPGAVVAHFQDIGMRERPDSSRRCSSAPSRSPVKRREREPKATRRTSESLLPGLAGT